MTVLTQRLIDLLSVDALLDRFGKQKTSVQKYQRNQILKSDAQVSFKLDMTLIWVIFVLLIFGMVMVYSASIAMPDNPRFANLTGT